MVEFRSHSECGSTNVVYQLGDGTRLPISNAVAQIVVEFTEHVALAFSISMLRLHEVVAARTHLSPHLALASIRFKQ